MKLISVLAPEQTVVDAALMVASGNGRIVIVTIEDTSEQTDASTL